MTMEKQILSISEILSQEISSWKAELELVAPAKMIGKKIKKQLVKTIEIFDKFKTGYRDFLLVNLDKIDAPPDWLSFRIEQTLLEYWEPIKRATSHFLHYPELIENGFTKLKDYKDKLDVTKNIPAILYFDKVPRALRIPFGPFFFIGIPVTDAYRDEWTAIPHELGHQVYWNSQFMINNSPVMPCQQQVTRFAKPISREDVFADFIEEAIAQQECSADRKQELRNELGQWSEEIFAEVIGTKIAGKEFAEFAWQKVSCYIKRSQDADANDGKHPKPYLLPFMRDCANQNAPELRSYITTVQERIFKGKEINNPEMDLLEALTILIGKLSNITNTLQPIIPSKSKYNPFERLRAEFPDDKSVTEKLLQPVIQQGGLTWPCECPAENNICIDKCINGVHTIPVAWLIFRPLVCG